MPFPKDTTLCPVQEGEVNWDIVQKEIERIEKIDSSSPIANKVRREGRIKGNAIQFLFPRWAFYAFEYFNYQRKGFEDKHANLAGGLGHTVAVASESKEIMRLCHYGNYEDYGNLLKEAKITINNIDDARLVWDAFCEIHRKKWKSQKTEKVSETEWKLGILSIDEPSSIIDGIRTYVKRTYFMKVTTDSISKQITGWKSIVETSDKRFEQMK
jgi:hypothetical protein